LLGLDSAPAERVSHAGRSVVLFVEPLTLLYRLDSAGSRDRLYL
jgi:hypothetical protein